MSSILMPVVIEREGSSERAMDLASVLLKDRIIQVYGEVDQRMADIVTAELLYLEREDPEADITMYINSPGGSVDDGLAIYDTMQFIRPDVATVAIGKAMSMGSCLLMAGAPGKRYSMPNADIMIHQPSGGSQGKASDMKISWEHMLGTKQKLIRLYAKHCGREYEFFETAMDRDNFLSPEEALELNLIDKIISCRGEV